MSLALALTDSPKGSLKGLSIDRENENDKDKDGGGGGDLETKENGIILLSARALKSLVKKTGHRLSSNAFGSMDNFVKNFIQSLAQLVNEAIKKEEGRVICNDKSAKEGQADDGKVKVTWPAIMLQVKRLVPLAESWFETWYSHLNQHYKNDHNEISDDGTMMTPCSCREASEECTLVLIEECESAFKLGMSPFLVENPLIISSIIYTLNDIVEWIIGISIKALESKGGGRMVGTTIKRGEVLAVLEKAPIFENLNHYTRSPPTNVPASIDLTCTSKVAPLNSTNEDKLDQVLEEGLEQSKGFTSSSLNYSTCSTARSPSSLLIQSIPIQFLSPLVDNSDKDDIPLIQTNPEYNLPKDLASPTMMNSSEKDTRPIQNPLSSLNMQQTLPSLGPLSLKELSPPSSLPPSTPPLYTRVIACTDPDCSWIKVSLPQSELAGLRGTIVKTKSVETDDIYQFSPFHVAPVTTFTPANSSSIIIDGGGEERIMNFISIMRQELDTLKALVAKLVQANPSYSLQ